MTPCLHSSQGELRTFAFGMSGSWGVTTWESPMKGIQLSQDANRIWETNQRETCVSKSWERFCFRSAVVVSRFPNISSHIIAQLVYQG